VSPGVGVDVEGVAVLSEAVDQGAEARGIVEHGAPLLVSEIGGQDDRAFFVSATDDVKQQIGGPAVARDISKFVQNE
jgi:hypothetical protein